MEGSALAWLIVIPLCFIAVVQWRQTARYLKAERERSAALAVQAEAGKAAEARNVELQRRIAALEPFQTVADAHAEAGRLIAEARQGVEKARVQAAALGEESATRARIIIQTAEAQAEKLAGDALRALADADRLEAAAVAMKNVIEGYGDRYIKPTYALLDELAEHYGFDQAGQDLKAARAATRLMIDQGMAAECDYVEAHRRRTAIAFVLDAFNGKADSILVRLKGENYGTQEQRLRDAFALVNHLGSAFRQARIAPAYLEARLTELRAAAAVQALREREREEQRRIREQIREEEKARREIERALKDAKREEDALQRALRKAQEQVARANEETRALYEARLAELQVKLSEAEARNQRALSMAQQTKAGHVYVISNIGSFGDDVFKIGMTRRLEPADRVRELGDASVPFPFDVHAMIWSDDAPALEYALHRRFLFAQINKVNPRKEFFRVPLGDLRESISALGVDAAWTIAADAAQYRETLAIEQQIAASDPRAKAWIDSQMAVLQEEVVGSSSDEEEDMRGMG